MRVDESYLVKPSIPLLAPAIIVDTDLALGDIHNLAAQPLVGGIQSINPLANFELTVSQVCRRKEENTESGPSVGTDRSTCFETYQRLSRRLRHDPGVFHP